MLFLFTINLAKKLPLTVFKKDASPFVSAYIAEALKCFSGSCDPGH